MNPTYPHKLRRGLQLRVAVGGLMAAALLSAGLGTARAGDMYQLTKPMTNGVGVPSQSVASITNITASTVTVCGYGLQGWYDILMSPTPSANPADWVTAGHTVASDYSWCLTVTNILNSPSAFVRLSQNNGYVGSGGCSGCHGDKYAGWSGTHHAKAYADLGGYGQGNASCLPCHTVGYGQPTGFSNALANAYLENVGCENCHGPAGWHKNSDHDLVSPAVTMAAEVCGGCHSDPYGPAYLDWTNSPHAAVVPDVAGVPAVSTNKVYTYSVTPTNGAPFVTNDVTSLKYYVTNGASVVTNLIATNVVTSSSGIYAWTDIQSNYNGTVTVYDSTNDASGYSRQLSCGPCHSGATRVTMLENYNNMLQSYGTNQLCFTNIFPLITNAFGLTWTNKMVTNVFVGTTPLTLPTAHDSATYAQTCATCHDPHGDYNDFQLRNPLVSTKFFSFFTGSNALPTVSVQNNGTLATNLNYMNGAFATQYDPSIQVCGQCHNSRGARWDGASRTWYGTNWVLTLPAASASWRPPHHSPQYNVFIGSLQPDYLNGTNNMFGPYSQNASGCAACHVMTITPPGTIADTNQVFTGHTFEMRLEGFVTNGWYATTNDAQAAIDATQSDTTNYINNLVVMLNNWATTKAPPAIATNYGIYSWEYTTAELSNPSGSAKFTNPQGKNVTITGPSDQTQVPDLIKQARFDMYIVHHDGSLGIHNVNYVYSLLTDASNKVWTASQP